MNTQSRKPALFAQFKDEQSILSSGETELTIDVSYCVMPDDDDNRCYPRGSDHALDNLHFIIRGGSFVHRITEGRSIWHDGASIVFNDMHYKSLDDMQRATKALKAVHASMDRISKKLGYATTPFELLGRFADAVNAHAFYFRANEESRSFSGQSFYVRNRFDGISQVKHEALQMEQALRKREPLSVAA